jgi:exosome complex component RRP42
MIIRVKQKQITQLMSEGKRLDKTEVLVGVKVEVGKPFSDTPNEGVLTVNVELVPLASPEFEPGPPKEKAVEIARVVDRGIRESKAIDLEKLCLQPGKNVLVIFIDIYVLNHDGNLIDASALAALAALLNTKMPKYEVNEEGDIIVKSGYSPLPMQNYPIATTFAEIDGKLAVDPYLEEEEVMDSRLTMTVEKDGKICATQKGGSGSLTREQILNVMRIAGEKAVEIRKLVVKE